MLTDIRAENIKSAPGSFHTGSEGMDNSECRQLVNAVGGGPGGRAVGSLRRGRGSSFAKRHDLAIVSQ